MKILVIFPHIPWPLYSGSAVRVFNISKELSKLGHELFLFAGDSKEGLNEMKDVFRRVFLYERSSHGKWASIARSLVSLKPYPASKLQSSDFSKKLSNILKIEKFDAILVTFTALADMLPENLHKKTLVILDQHESEKLMYEDYFKNGRFHEKVFAFSNLLKIKKFYEKAYSKVNAIISVSESEAEDTRKYAVEGNTVFCLSNGVSEEFLNNSPQGSSGRNRIIFCANLAIKRNVEAIKWFSYSIFPKVQEKIKDAQLHIVGSWPPNEVKQMQKLEGIKVLGQVGDIRNYYRDGEVFIVPYKFGAGTKIKIFEAMASNIPIVSTVLGIRGIDVVPGKHLLVADKEIDFADNVVTLLQDKNASNTIRENALDLIKRKYLWPDIIKRLENQMILLKNEKQI